MMVIHEDFEKRIKQVIHPNVIWDHLNTMYDMDLLDESTYFPPPLDEDADFALPADDFGDKITNKVKSSGGEVKIEDLEGITTSGVWYGRGDRETHDQKAGNETSKTSKEERKVIKEERKAEKDDKPLKKVKTEVKIEPEESSKEKKKPGRKPKTKEGETVATPTGKESRSSTTPGEKASTTPASAVTGTPASGTTEKKKRMKKDDKADKSD